KQDYGIFLFVGELCERWDDFTENEPNEEHFRRQKPCLVYRQPSLIMSITP
ncbi:hypothetical protein BB560_004888, partial [Smittium megazygosporum]